MPGSDGLSEPSRRRVDITITPGAVGVQDRRAVRAEGKIVDTESGDILATGASTFIAVPPNQLEQLKARYGM